MARNFPERSAVDRVGHAVLQRLVPPLDVVQAVDHQVLGRPRGSQVLESHERVRNRMIFIDFPSIFSKNAPVGRRPAASSQPKAPATSFLAIDHVRLLPSSQQGLLEILKGIALLLIGDGGLRISKRISKKRRFSRRTCLLQV